MLNRVEDIRFDEPINYSRPPVNAIEGINTQYPGSYYNRPGSPQRVIDPLRIATQIKVVDSNNRPVTATISLNGVVSLGNVPISYFPPQDRFQTSIIPITGKTFKTSQLPSVFLIKKAGYTTQRVTRREGNIVVRLVKIVPKTIIKVVDATTGKTIDATLGLNGLKGLGANYKKQGNQYTVFFEPFEKSTRATVTAKGYKSKVVLVVPGKPITVVLESDNSSEIVRRKKFSVVRAKAIIRILKLTSI